MQQYTTEWAKEYLREHEDVTQVHQFSDGEVWEISVNEINPTYISFMLEHPDGWKNSKVTRDML